MANRPVDVTEDELLALLKEALDQEVFSPEFLHDLGVELAQRAQYPQGT
jgi:hypothetical protein